MTSALRWLRLDDARWSAVGPRSLTTGVGFAVGMSVLMAWNRFGGQVIDAPRAFVRMTLIGIYGWLGLTVGVWLVAGLVRPRNDGSDERRSLASFAATLTGVGLAHAPMLFLSIVIAVAAGLFRLLGPGMAVAVFVYAFWFPALLMMAARHSFGLGIGRAVTATIVPYVAWLLLVGDYLLGRVEHLL